MSFFKFFFIIVLTFSNLFAICSFSVSPSGSQFWGFINYNVTDSTIATHTLKLNITPDFGSFGEDGYFLVTVDDNSKDVYTNSNLHSSSIVSEGTYKKVFYTSNDSGGDYYIDLENIQTNTTATLKIGHLHGTETNIESWNITSTCVIPNLSPEKPIIGTATFVKDISKSISVTRGTDPDNDTVKVSCSAANSNRTISNPYVSSLSTGGSSTNVSFRFSEHGTQTITCKSIDSEGKSSIDSTQKSVSVNLAPVNGQCGDADGRVFGVDEFNYGIYQQCSIGTSNNTSYPSLGSSVNWTCLGSNGGTNDSCSASRESNFAISNISPNKINATTSGISNIDINGNGFTSNTKLYYKIGSNGNWNEKPTNSITTTKLSTTILHSAGTGYWYYQARDGTKVSNEVALEFYQESDTIKPIIEINTEASNEEKTSNFYLNVTATDNISLKSIGYSILTSSGTSTNVADSFLSSSTSDIKDIEIDISTLNDGSYKVKVYARDTSLNISNYKYYDFIKNTGDNKPILIILNTTGSKTKHNSNFSLEVIAADDNMVSTIQWGIYDDGASGSIDVNGALVTKTIDIDVDRLANIYYEVRIKAIDSDGQSSEEAVYAFSKNVEVPQEELLPSILLLLIQ